ncbi:MAG: LptF/LptG family permease [Lentisphaeria bacterium]|jgi:lipopolysaccharide export system permease protein
MRLLNLYLGRKLLLATAASLGVLTFVMLAGNLFKISDLVARGLSLAALGHILLFLLPVALKFTIPFAALCAVILVFSRLAADNEITAMRATGIGLWQIVSPALLLGILLSGVCLYLQSTLAPHCRWEFDLATEQESVRNPLAAIEPGRFVELPGLIVYAAGQEPSGRLHDIRIYVLDDQGRLVQDISARSGDVTVHEEREQVELRLHEALVTAADPAAPEDVSKLQHVTGKTLTFPLNYGDEINRRRVNRKLKHQTSADLLSLIAIYHDRGADTSLLRLELHRRLSMALSPFAFILVGIPFGIRARRGEAAIGLVFALILATLFYAFIILADELKSAIGNVELIVWLPNIAYQLGGTAAIWRLARH